MKFHLAAAIGLFLLLLFNLANGSSTTGSEAAYSNSEPIVNEVTLEPIPPQVVNSGETVTFQAAGSDSDPDANGLTFSLVNMPTDGAVIDPATGTFSWTPTRLQGPSVYTFDVQVTDGKLTATRPVQITVNDPTAGAPSANSPVPDAKADPPPLDPPGNARASLQSEYDQLNSEIDHNTAVLDRTESELSSRKASLDRLSDTINSMKPDPYSQDEIDAYNAEVRKYESRRRSYNRAVDSYNRSLAKQKDRIKRINAIAKLLNTFNGL